MTWTLLVVLVLVLGLSLFATLTRRAELKGMERTLARRERAVASGADAAKLQHPVIDLTRCLGCGTCVRACPEDGVLELAHGQAVVVNGARCVGVASCERECPTGAIQVTLADLATRKDVPNITDELEAVGAPGLFLAGEVTAHALIRTAVDHGAAVGVEVGRRVRATPWQDERVLDLVIVGAGPAGLACALEAKRQGLRYVALEQEDHVGGTVARYPRRKLVLTEPVELPLRGHFKQREYSKEELIDLWRTIVHEEELAIRTGEVLRSIERDGEGAFVVRTGGVTYVARHVCLALGRRGVPRRLDVPGEDLPKVTYSLLDAESYRDRRILVVGGGDSAVETALALAEQPGNEVTLSYRKESFFRIRARNEEKLARALAEGRLTVVHNSRVAAIYADQVELTVDGPEHPERRVMRNDDVFVMIGGTPPFELLASAGVSFDPAQRAPSEPLDEQGSGLLRALVCGFLLSAAALAWALWFGGYYMLPAVDRPAHELHDLLRPAQGVGLALGIAAAGLVVVNLLYLVRRSPRFRLRFGSLQAWMTSHVATGVLALLCAMLHASMQPRDTVGGRAFWALVVLLVTGSIGRYFYAYVPRAANGSELDLAEAKARLAGLALQGDARQQEFLSAARDEVQRLIDARQWRGSFVGRVLALMGVQRDLRRMQRVLLRDGRAAGVPELELRRTLRVARRAHKTALMVAHYEDLRALLSTWRYLHRWVAAAMVLLMIAHIVYALAYRVGVMGGAS